MNLNGHIGSDSPSSSGWSDESQDKVLRALYGKFSEEERTAFKQTMSAVEMQELRALQRLTEFLSASSFGEEANPSEYLINTASDNTFYEQQWTILRSNIMQQQSKYNQPILPQMPHNTSLAVVGANALSSTRYGAIELLQFIPKATTRGFAAAASICLLFLLGYTGFMTYSSARLKRGPAINKMKLTNLPPPPAATEAAPPPPPTAAGPAARAGTPVPVPDALVAPDVKDFANVDEISRASITGGDGTDTGYLGLASDVDTEVREEEADPYAFVPVEKEPYIDIKDLQKKVVYPDLAKRAGIEGKVNIRVLVGKNGMPKKHIIESSDSDLLNDAAVRAVMSSVFTPAIQNNQPIDCWVSIPIVFRLR